VKVEGENVVRMGDMTTHNHASCPSNTPPQVYIDEASTGLANFDKCKEEKKAVDKACKKPNNKPCPGKLSTPKERSRDYADAATKDGNSTNCAKKVKCFLRPYKTDGNNSCCDGQTGHHIPPWSTIATAGTSVTHGACLTLCLEGTNHSIGSHGRHHHGINYLLKKMASGVGAVFKLATNARKNKLYKAPLSDHVKASAAVTEEQTDCSKECIEQQLNDQFTKAELKKEATHNASTTGGESYDALASGDATNLNSVAAGGLS
jgi:GHH signature containing HNH/Endo VII superfamily nuclease toxin  2